MSSHRAQQRSIFEILIDDRRPMHEWLAAIERIVPAVYPYDAELSRELEAALGRLSWNAATLDCARVDDPATPDPDATAAELLHWSFDESSRAAALRRLITRADQLLGRHRLLEIAGVQR
jgi:hypothetical protein